MWATKKYAVATKKIMTLKRRFMLTENVAQKRDTYLQKIVPVAFKYMLNWLKSFVSREKYFDVVQKLKMVAINVPNFCRNGAPFCLSQKVKDLRTICVILFFKKTNFLQDFHICISASFNKFVLFTNQKQPMKCVRQNNYLDMVSYTWYIIWQGVHFLVKLQAEGTNK